MEVATIQSSRYVCGKWGTRDERSRILCQELVTEPQRMCLYSHGLFFQLWREGQQTNVTETRGPKFLGLEENNCSFPQRKTKRAIYPLIRGEGGGKRVVCCQ